MENNMTYSAFAGQRLIVSGNLEAMLLKTKGYLDLNEGETILIFEDQTGQQTDFDFRGTFDDVLSRLSSHPMFAQSQAPTTAQTGPGRPKLGVVSREVTLLPRHWDWLEQESGGISVTLRKLVDEARKRGKGQQVARKLREAAGKFMWAIGGNLPNFEEASRALFAGDRDQLQNLIHEWPKDIRNHVEKLVNQAAELEQEAKDD